MLQEGLCDQNTSVHLMEQAAGRDFNMALNLQEYGEGIDQPHGPAALQHHPLQGGLHDQHTPGH